MGEPRGTPMAAERPSDDRLNSWKEIAAYLRRDVRTVQRWERREGMPVQRHLHDKLGSVYALRSELDAWVASRTHLEDKTAGGVGPMPASGSPIRTPGGWRRLWALAGSLVATAIAVAVFDWIRATPTASDIRSVAVLPLQNLSGDPGQEYFADGMTEALIGRLSAIPELRVISRTSAMRFKSSPHSVPEIARMLRVDAVIEGSVLRDGTRVRIAAQLIRGNSDEHIWSATYDRELADVLALQSEVADAIVRQIELTLGRAPHEPKRAARTLDPEVYEHFLKGRFALNEQTRSSFEEAVRQFDAAIVRDSSFAPAHAGLAEAYLSLSLVFAGAPPAEARPRALEAARRALALDPDIADAHVVLASALLDDWQWKESAAAIQRALALNPNLAAAHGVRAEWLLSHGRLDEALVWAQRGRELDPLALVGRDIGWILFHARRYDEAVRELRAALAVQPDDARTSWILAFALLGRHSWDEAAMVLEEIAATTDRSAGVLGLLVRAYAHGGRHPDARQVLAELTRRREAEYVPAAAFVNAYLGLDDHEQAFAWLERALQERSSILKFVKVHPFFDPLRDDRRFADLVRRVGLPD